jgi:hypothetical protein
MLLALGVFVQIVVSSFFLCCCVGTTTTHQSQSKVMNSINLLLLALCVLASQGKSELPNAETQRPDPAADKQSPLNR